jgi:hypothetical protein
MTENATLAEGTEAAHELLMQTQERRVQWQATSDPEVFRSVRSKAVAVLDRIGDPPRIRLRFSILGHTDNDMTIEQTVPYPQQPDQRTLYKLLAALWHEVQEQAEQGTSASDLFLRGEPGNARNGPQR